MYKKIDDMAKHIGTSTILYVQENNITRNESMNAMAIAYAIMAHSMSGDGDDMDQLKANLLGAVADVFDSMVEANSK
jgi:hypothetical protein